MKKVWWLLLLFIPVVNATLISDWPFFFVQNGKFVAKYVIAEEASSLDVISATVVSTSLARYENVTTEVGTATLDTEISDITRHNAIVIGSPCDNRAAYKLMGEPEPCYRDLGGSVGYVKLYENNGKVQLLITGVSEKDRNAAAKFLAQANIENVRTKEHIVPSNSGSVPLLFEKKLRERKNISSNITANESSMTNFTTVSNVTIAKPVQATVAPTKAPAGAYEPLDEVPVKKKLGFWASLWKWIKGLFT